MSNAIGAAFSSRRRLEPVEARLMTTVGGLLLASAILFAWLPLLLVYPAIALLTWVAATLLYRGYKLHKALGSSEEEKEE